MQLPHNIDPTHFHSAYRLQSSECTDAIQEICLEHGIAFEQMETFPNGSNLLASIGNQYVIKVFPPFHRNQWESEWKTLEQLSKHSLSMSIHIPKLIAFGKRKDGWTYAVISKLSGVTLESVWHQISIDEKCQILKQIGQMMSQVHDVPVDNLLDLPPNWDEFLESQYLGHQKRHSRLGMPEWFLEDSKKFVEQHYPNFPTTRPVILTGEYTPFNLLTTKNNGVWTISGMIDFGDAMIGPREYDFLGPVLFLTEGNPEFLDSLFDGYNYSNPRKDLALRDRLMLLAILHRYSNLKVQIRISGWEDRVQDLQELIETIFPR